MQSNICKVWQLTILWSPRRGACDIEVCPVDVGVDPHAQIRGIDRAFKVIFVHLHEIVIALLEIPAKVMPHQVVHNTLCHTLGAQEARIERLVAPFDPSSSCRHTIYETQSAHFFRIGQGKASQNIPTSSHPKSNHRLQTKMRQHKQQLSRQLLHGRIDVAGDEERQDLLVPQSLPRQFIMQRKTLF